MRWPWQKKTGSEEERLKDRLRRRAREVQSTSSDEPLTPSAALKLAHQAPVAVVAETAGFDGTDLTLYIRRHGRVLAFGKRPVPQGQPQPALEYFGLELTHYIDRKNERQTVAARRQRRMNPLQAVLWGAGVGLKWVFGIKPKILIIERYIWTECFGHFLLGSLGFTIFMIITSIFSLGEKIFSKDIPPFTIARVLMLSAPAFLVLAIPVAVVFATLMGMSRLNRDNELVAFATNGISLYRIFIPFISLGIFAGIMTWLIYENIVPPNNQQYKDVLKVFWESQVVDFIKPGIVIKAPERKYFYVDSINKTEGIMYGLRLYDYFQGEAKPARGFPRIFAAERAWVKDKFLVLSNVKLYELDEQKGDSLVCASMPEIKIDIGARTKDYLIQPHPTELTAEELRNRIHRRRDSLNASRFPSPSLRQNLLVDWTEYYFKYSIPFACLAFVLVAVPVSLRGPRDERNLGIIMSFILVMAYYILFFIARTIGSRGIIPVQDYKILGVTLIHQGSNLFPPLLAGWLAAGVFLDRLHRADRPRPQIAAAHVAVAAQSPPLDAMIFGPCR